MNKFLVGSLFVVLVVLSACGPTPVPASAPAQVTTSSSATTVKSETIPVEGEPVVEASEVVTTVTTLAEVPVVLANVSPKTVSYPVLGGSQVMPFRDMGDGSIIVPVGYTCLMTTDPFVFFDSFGNELARGKASVVLFDSGSFRVETVVAPSGAINAWTTCSNLLLDTFVVQQLNALSLNVGYEAGLVDLRSGAVQETSVVTATAVTAQVTETLPVEVPVEKSANVTVEVTEVSAVACVPDDVSFISGYTNPPTVVLHDDVRWIIAGMDPATINGVVYAGKSVVVVAPGVTVTIENLAYGPEHANIYACAYVAQPTEAQIDATLAREGVDQPITFVQ